MKKPQYLRDAQAAKRKVEIASGIRTDARFVGKTIPSKRRKNAEEVVHREMCDRRPSMCNSSEGFFNCYAHIDICWFLL